MKIQTSKLQLSSGSRWEDIEHQVGPIAGALTRLRRGALQAAIGHEIRNCRLKRGWTVEDLAQAASISMGAVSRIESGAISPSLATLQLLSSALGVPISLLLHRFEQKRDAVFTKAIPQGQLAHHFNSAKALGSIDTANSHIKLEPQLVKLTKQMSAFPSFQHNGVKFLYMLRGGVRYTHGHDHYDLLSGDSLFLTATVKHGPSKILHGSALYLSISSVRG